MRLEATAGYLSKVRQSSLLLWIFLLLLTFRYDAYSQDYKLTFPKGTTLSDALIQASHTYNFKVAFDSKRLQTVNAKEEVSGNSIGDFLSDLMAHTGFSFIYKHGSYLIVEDHQAGNEQPLQCLLMGSVIDGATGEQLPFASVSLPDQNIYAMASTNGTFSIKDIVSNPVHIIVNYIGYRSADTLISWNGKSMNACFSLTQNVIKIKSVDVIKSKVEIVDYRSDADFATIINPGRLIDMPLYAETDIFRTLELLPGINYSENSSELNIRGGTGDQNLVLFDGQTLYNLSHYYGVFSSINPYIVKDIQVFKGGFDSRYGERISGIVDITGKSGNKMKPSLNADINLLSVNLAAEIPVTRKLTLVAAARRSFSDIYKTSFAENLFEKYEPKKNNPADRIAVSEPSFHFFDLNGKLNYQISDKENLSLSAYGGKDDYRNAYTIDNPSLHISNVDSSSWYNYGASLNWQKQWSPSFFSSLLLGSSGYNSTATSHTDIIKLQQEAGNTGFLPDSQNVFNTRFDNELTDLSLSLRNSYTVNSFNHLDFGFLFRGNEIYYHKDADKIYIYDNTRQSAFTSVVYAQDKIQVSDKFIFKPGFRLTFYDGSNQVLFEPRLAARYKFSDNFSCRLATGKYNQFISQVSVQQATGYSKSFWVLSNDSINPVLKANHLILGMIYAHKQFTIDVEGYYKYYKGIQEYFYVSEFLKNSNFDQYFQPNPDPHPQPVESGQNPSYFISGSGRSYGIDFFMSYNLSNFTSWISYSLSRSLQSFDKINNGEEMPALTDQTHKICFSNLYTVGKWNLGAVFLYSTGRPYVSAIENVMSPSITQKYKRLPDYSRLDVSANYNFTIKSARLKIGASMINLLNKNNYFDANSRTYDFENTTFSQTNLIQSQKLSLNLFIHLYL
jgi:ferric enterobactin receptor